AASSASTDDEGNWTVSGLSNGQYEITASAPGFQITRSVISYDANSPASYQVGLRIGGATETVEVSASAPTVETDAAMISTRKQKKNKTAPAPPPPPPAASANVYNLQQRAAGVLPVPVTIPRDGTSYRFLRPLVIAEETRLSFTYKSK
ncbi:MAG TPA: carboxypeptidase-like regulatory domain-containing protein, partial [Methylomirabilota bacterium]|nr:carboxypeptidase-like regulatory domain-containing protein [Methylomirabilota bacterium]